MEGVIREKFQALIGRELENWLGTEGELYAAMAVGYAEGSALSVTRKRIQDVVEWRE